MSYFTRLPFYLTWEFYWDTPTLIKAEYIQRRDSLFRSWLASHQKVSRSIQDDFNRLPPKSRKRILMAPATALLIKSPEIRSVVWLRQMIRAEQYRIGTVSRERGKKYWTCTGDKEFPNGKSAPHIRGVICLDAYSPWSKMDFTGCNETNSIHSPAEIETIRTRLEQTVDLIGQTSKSAANGLLTMVQTIAIRKDLAAPNNCGSSSWPTAPGKIGLTNAHLPQIRVEWIANALVHESIHSLLYAIESGEAFYENTKEPHSILLTSPWSGKLLPLHSFTHACFVWFALWNFWKVSLGMNIFDQRQSTVFFETAASGFLRSSPAEVLATIKCASNLHLLGAVRQMQKIVRSDPISNIARE